MILSTFLFKFVLIFSTSFSTFSTFSSTCRISRLRFFLALVTFWLISSQSRLAHLSSSGGNQVITIITLMKTLKITLLIILINILILSTCPLFIITLTIVLAITLLIKNKTGGPLLVRGGTSHSLEAVKTWRGGVDLAINGEHLAHYSAIFQMLIIQIKI